MNFIPNVLYILCLLFILDDQIIQNVVNIDNIIEPIIININGKCFFLIDYYN